MRAARPGGKPPADSKVPATVAVLNEGRSAEPGNTSKQGNRFVVDAATSGMRVDQLVARYTRRSAAAARGLIDRGLVLVGGRVAVKGDRLFAGAIVDIAAHEEATPLVLSDAAVELLVLYEDDHLIAIDKPAGLPSHPLRAGERGTAANGIVARFPGCAAASIDPREGGLGHRLDTATSGVLIAARSRPAWVGLRQALGAADCEKRYLCEVWGDPPDTGAIDVEIGRSGRRGGVVKVGGGRHPRPAATAWSVVARRESTTLLEARLHAGRAHQVRAHLAAAGFPIVGDDRYGGVRDLPPSRRLHLHASAVRFRHPVTGQMVVIEAPAPPWAATESRAAPNQR